MATRYEIYKILDNDIEHYSFLRKTRPANKKIIRHYETPTLYHPSVFDRTITATTSYLWKYGDHFYQLAHEYYGDSTYWWVIAWYNGYPTEVDIYPGKMIEIPINLKDALDILGV
jgi:nucleoid-associated protein YgaU